jgi:hypothetical protein
MAKKTAKKATKKAAKQTATPQKLTAGDYVIPRGKEGCRVTVESMEFVIPRGRAGCQFTVEED